MVSPVYHLPPELVRKIGDLLVGIKEWATDTASGTPRPAGQTTEFGQPAPSRFVDFIGLRTLPSLATASRFFLEPVLDALWDTLPDYGILVYLLPRDAWAVETLDFRGSHGPTLGDNESDPRFQYVSITRPLTEDEVKRMEYYTPRVKRIQELCPLFPVRFRGYVICESSVLASFAPCWTPENPIFPNLRVLDVTPANDQYPAYYRFFHVLFGPRLRRISNDYTAFPPMTKTVPPADYQQMLVRLQESAPLLSHLHLNADVPPYDPTIISAMSNAICTFKHLVSVRTGPLPITEQAFRYLAELPHLEVINVRLPDTITEASFRRAPFDEIFPSLRELRLAHLFNLNLISLIVQHTRSPRLEIISAESVDEDRPVPLEDVMSFFSAILSRNNAEHIKELTVEALPIEWTPQNTFTNQHLEPLFALKSLTTLKLHLRCTFDLDDAILERTARAWPNIRTLDLGPGSTGVRVPSLAALIPFAQHCPELQVLGFTLDADLCRVPPDIRDSARDYAQRELRVLKVGCAEVADPRCVAAFLADLFPHLRDIECGSIDANGMEIGAAAEWDWEEVCEEHLPAVARERGIVFEPTLDEIDARVMKAWYIGRRTSEQ